MPHKCGRGKEIGDEGGGKVGKGRRIDWVGKGEKGKGKKGGEGCRRQKGLKRGRETEKLIASREKGGEGRGWHRRKKCRELQETRVGEGGVRGREPDVKAEVGGPLSGTAGLLKDVLSVFLVCES